LSSNTFSGEIPQSLTEQSNLKILDLRNSKLSGNVPGSIVDLVLLSELNLSGNSLEGILPALDLDVSEIEDNLGLREIEITVETPSSSNATAQEAQGEGLSIGKSGEEPPIQETFNGDTVAIYKADP
jgi:Leucine-rich repeat (LRR) protein